MEIIRDPKATAPRAYAASFTGVTLGALGRSTRYTVRVFADTPETARVALYTSYEHLSAVTIEEVANNDY